MGILYGLPKIHKQDVPIRPILAAYNLPSYALAKFLNNLLESYAYNDEYILKNSYEFANLIQNYDSRFHMSSFDVVSLFTNIPLEETIDIIINIILPAKMIHFMNLQNLT